MPEPLAAATWACPHCGARQAGEGRCWVCRRSSTCCATCVNFRRSVAAALGYCGLDRARQPLRGDEQRGCWQPPADDRPTIFGAAVGSMEPVGAVSLSPGQATRAPREWTPVDGEPSKSG